MPNTVQTRTVSLASGTTCVFSYETRAFDLSALSDGTAATTTVNMNTLLETLEGYGCVQSSASFWTYEVCFKNDARRGATQSSGQDRYNIGKTPRVDELQVVFPDGELCGAISSPRTTTIKFSCDPSIQKPIIVSVSEARTCTYQIMLALKDVCGDPRFPKVQDTLDSNSEKEVEDWIMEITKIQSRFEPDAEHAVCHVYSTELLADRSYNQFTQFSLRIEKADEDLQTVESLKSTDAIYIARHPDRTPLLVSELSVKARSISSSENFDGQLGYVKLVA